MYCGSFGFHRYIDMTVLSSQRCWMSYAYLMKNQDVFRSSRFRLWCFMKTMQLYSFISLPGTMRRVLCICNKRLKNTWHSSSLGCRLPGQFFAINVWTNERTTSCADTSLIIELLESKGEGGRGILREGRKEKSFSPSPLSQFPCLGRPDRLRWNINTAGIYSTLPSHK